MTRLTLLRLAWLFAFVAITVPIVLAYEASGRRPLYLAAIVVALLLPGRIQGYFFRDLFTGRRLFDQGRHRDAIDPLSRFIEVARKRRFYKHLLWLGWPGFSIDPLAMALNNRGACYLELAELTLSETDLRNAIELDPKSPLPFVNLALVHTARGEVAEAELAWSHATALGFRGNFLDLIQTRASGAFASLEGRKKA